MSDTDLIEDWTIFDPLKSALRLGDSETNKVFKDEDEPFKPAIYVKCFGCAGSLKRPRPRLRPIGVTRRFRKCSRACR